MKCSICSELCIKAGLQRSGVQKFFCKSCRRYQQESYTRNGWKVDTDKMISQFMTEGLGVRATARILKIAVSTVIEKLKQIGNRTNQPLQCMKGRIYEIDELWTYVEKKAN